MISARATLIIPVLLVLIFVAGFLALKPFDDLGKGAPPLESLTVTSTRLDEQGIHVTLQAAGSKAMTIAQVQVDLSLIHI